MREKPMNVLVIGSGAREHALAFKLSQSPEVKALFCLPGNAGTSGCATNLPGSVEDLDAIVRLAKERGVDLVVVGPEDPLVRGLADKLREAGILTFGPDREAAQLEGSKAFSKELMAS